MATSEPSASLAMQPASSHRILSASVLSPGVRASASAASHSRNANVSFPVLIMASRPSAPRTAKAPPSAATRTSGCGVRIAHTTAQPIRIAPMRRSQVFNRHSTTRPAEQSSNGPVPNAAMRPTAPGRLVTQSATAIIQPMPSPISRQQWPSSPNGMATRPTMPAGITQIDTTGIASRLASTP